MPQDGVPTVKEQSSTCEHDDLETVRCEFSSATIGVYTFEMIKRYGPQPDDLFETNLRILGYVDSPNESPVQKTIFELSGNKELSPNFELVGDRGSFIIERAQDFKKLRLYSLKGIGNSIVAFQYWSGGQVPIA